MKGLVDVNLGLLEKAQAPAPAPAPAQAPILLSFAPFLLGTLDQTVAPLGKVAMGEGGDGGAAGDRSSDAIFVRGRV